MIVRCMVFQAYINFTQTQQSTKVILLFAIQVYQPMHQQKAQRSTLKILQDKGTLTIQAETLALQLIFASPVLQLSEYLEQIEKYNYRAALSGINLKVDEFDQYYKATKEKVEDTYNTLVYRTMEMIQDLFLALRSVKIEMWREEVSVANALKTHLYHKTLDPYSFKPQQFDADVKCVLDSFKCGTVSSEELEKLVSNYSKRTKDIEVTQMQTMFSGKVSEPYLAQNVEAMQVNPSSIYSSLLTQIRFKAERSNQSYQHKHFAIHEEILRFCQFTCDRNLRTQRTAGQLIRRYNQTPVSDFQLYSITPPSILQGEKQHEDAQDLLPGKQLRLQSKSILANKIQRAQFKGVSRVLFMESGHEEQVKHMEFEEGQRTWDKMCMDRLEQRHSPFDTYSEKRHYNPKEFYNLRDFQKQKYREQELKEKRQRQRQREREYRDKERERQPGRQKEKIIYRKIIRNNSSIPPLWTDFIECMPLIHHYQVRQLKENHIWELRNKDDKNYISYTATKNRLGHTPYFQTSDEKSRQEAERKREAAQILRIDQSEVQLKKIRLVSESRNYEMFMEMSKLQSDVPPSSSGSKIVRYGITFKTSMLENADVDSDAVNEIDRFFFLYFKQRYYRENESVKSNNDNPIIYLDSQKISMESDQKKVSQYISSISKRAQTIPFFLIWSDDIIAFRNDSTKEGSIASFEFYPYVNPSNSQKLMYELRRRLYLKMRQSIREDYCGASEIDRVYSKVEVAHRILYQKQHFVITLQKSIQRGKKIAQQIIESLR